MAEKRKVKIRGLATTEIKEGESAIIINDAGEWLKTSPVVYYSIHASVVYIETKNTIYTNA